MDWSDKLGELLMRDVRDRSIESMLQMLDGETRAPRVVALRSALQQKYGDAGVDGARFVLKETVDLVMFHFLSLLEEHAAVVKLGVEDDGAWVDAAETSDGLGGELYSSDGWIQRFSRFEKGPVA